MWSLWLERILRCRLWDFLSVFTHCRWCGRDGFMAFSLQTIIINFFFKYSTYALLRGHNVTLFFGRLTNGTLNDTTHFVLTNILCIFFPWKFLTLAFLWHLLHDRYICTALRWYREGEFPPFYCGKNVEYTKKISSRCWENK